MQRALTFAIGCMLAAAAHGQLAVSDGGTPTYTRSIAVPPGVAGLVPQLGLSYAGGGVNGPLGHGWSLQGLSVITRCPGNEAIDGKKSEVGYVAADKLCLDGQRLIQTDDAGSPLPFPQANDALGRGTGAHAEYRTEKDSFARVRAYGYANGDSTGASGPAYFRVWTKAGQVYDYGDSPAKDANTKALVSPTGKSVAVAWAVARISDTFGNFIDYKYEQRDVAWGSGPTVGSPTPGHEWNVIEIQYSGNKIVFSYADRAARQPQDAGETYHQGSKNLSLRLLQSITAYVNARDTATLGAGSGVAATSTRLTYGNGSVTGRSRVSKVQQCAGGPASTRCLPAVSFNYSEGSNDAYQVNAAFRSSALATTVLQNQGNTLGVILGDFNGDGKADFIRWSDDPTQNRLFLSSGDGSFQQVANGSGSGQFNIATNLFKSDGCYTSMVADFNGDGLPDILRYSAATKPSDNTACPTPGVHYIFMNAGNGSFAQTTVTGPTLKQKVSQDATICGGNPNTGPCAPLKYGSTEGANFYIIDVDGDGKMDIITAQMPAQAAGAARSVCTGNVCTHVYIGTGNGSFVERASNLSAQLVFQNPAGPNGFTWGARLVDIDGDGLQDLASMWNGNAYVGSTTNSWRSRGDGNFDPAPNPAPCGKAIDFNGDGRSDCVVVGSTVAGNKLQVSNSPGTQQDVAGFNLVSTGQELGGAGVSGMEPVDINRDGRQDILRAKDDPAGNVLYLSNGDGTFTASTTFNLGGSTPVQLQKSDNTYSYVTADFTGRGSTEILRMASAPAAGDATSNLLLVKTDPTPPDQLVSVSEGTGSTTTLYYVPLSNATPSNGVSASLGSRYTSDRGTGRASSSPLMDLTVPMYVVATTTADSGVGSAKVQTEYSYLGLKAHTAGRGMLGFREVRQQGPGANGESLSVLTQYLQVHPYIGMAAQTDTRRGTLDNASAPLLKSVVRVYCEQGVASAAPSATSTAPCAATARIQRPYLYQSVESGFDLGGAPLPTVTTVQAFNGTGDPTSIAVSTVGTVAGLSQTFNKSTTNLYNSDDISCSDFQTCRWITGRLSRASVTSAVPESLSSVATSAGTAPNAAAVQGTGSLNGLPLSPAVLNAILQLLLDD